MFNHSRFLILSYIVGVSGSLLVLTSSLPPIVKWLFLIISPILLIGSTLFLFMNALLKKKVHSSLQAISASLKYKKGVSPPVR